MCGPVGGTHEGKGAREQTHGEEDDWKARGHRPLLNRPPVPAERDDHQNGADRCHDPLPSDRSECRLSKSSLVQASKKEKEDEEAEIDKRLEAKMDEKMKGKVHQLADKIEALTDRVKLEK